MFGTHCYRVQLMTVFKSHHCLLPFCPHPSKMIGTAAPSVAAEVQTTTAQPLPLNPTTPDHKTPREPPLPALSRQLLGLLGSVFTDVCRNPHSVSHKPFTLAWYVYDNGSLNISTEFGIGVHPFLGVTTTEETVAAANSLQSCLTLCDLIDGRPPGSPFPGILQARTLEWGAISFSNAWKWKVKLESFSRVQLLATPWTAAYQAPPSTRFSRQEYWTGTEETTTHWKTVCWEPHGGPVVDSMLSLSIPGLGTKFPASHAQCGQKKRKNSIIQNSYLTGPSMFNLRTPSTVTIPTIPPGLKAMLQAGRSKFSFLWDWFVPLGREAILGCFWLHLM